MATIKSKFLLVESILIDFFMVYCDIILGEDLAPVKGNFFRYVININNSGIWYRFQSIHSSNPEISHLELVSLQPGK